VISRSNKRVNAYNNGIRNRVLYREEELSPGDLLMITKTIIIGLAGLRISTFWPTVNLWRWFGYAVRNDVWIPFSAMSCFGNNDYGVEFEAKINLDSLHTEVRGLTP
jgi:exodeoxyribonuclease-5